MNSLKLHIKLLLIFLLSSTTLLAQNTGISDVANTPPDPSAVLDVYSTSKGMLVPRVTEVQRTAIATPATGLLVYQTNGTTPGFYYYTGTTWTPIASGSGSRWSLVPNTNNIYYSAGSTGFVGVGVTNPTRQFVVNNNLEIRRPLVNGAVAELLFTNTSGSGDFRIGSDGGDIFWQGGGAKSLQMGSFHTTIISGDRQQAGFPNTVGGIANRSVLINSSRDVSIPLTVQGFSATQTGNLTEWLNSAGTVLNVVNSAGNVGIGVTAPVQKLEVAGNLRLNGAFMPNNLPGAVGSVLQSNGAGVAPTWVDLSSAANTFNWTLGGNSLTGIRNLGTTSNFDLPFITNGTEKMRLMAGGNVGIGLAAPTEKLEVNGNVRITGANGGTRRLLFANTSSAGSALDPDGIIEVRPVNASEQQEMLFYMGNDNLTPNGPDRIRMVAEEFRLQTFDNSTNSSLANAEAISGGAVTRMIVTPAGNVGVGLVAPTQKLEITGNLRLNGAFMPNGAAGTAGQVLQSAGANNPPVWVAPGASTAWALGGNAVGAVNTLGTTSAFDLPIITSGAERMRITAAGNVGIGITPTTDKLEVEGNIKISGADGGTRRLTFEQSIAPGSAGTTDPEGIIEVRPVGTNEQQEMLFYMGNDNTTTYGPDRIRMVAEEFRFQTFNTDAGNIAGAESQTNVNNRMIIAPAGNVGIGTTDFDAVNPEKLLVDAGTTTSVNAIYAQGSINKYFQINVQNLSTGNQSSSDLVATANNGTETANFVNLGINGQNFNYTGGNITTGGPNDGYLISAGQNFYIANNNTGRDIIFLTGGTAATNEAMRITALDRIGIRNNNPNSTLSVGGSLTMPVRTTGGATNLTDTDHVVIYTGTTTTWNLPAAGNIRGRIYRIVNHGSGNLNITPSIITGSGTTGSFVAPGAAVEIISDGNNWRRMDD